jgi:hypothetical protein
MRNIKMWLNVWENSGTTMHSTTKLIYFREFLFT